MHFLCQNSRLTSHNEYVQFVCDSASEYIARLYTSILLLKNIITKFPLIVKFQYSDMYTVNTVKTVSRIIPGKI